MKHTLDYYHKNTENMLIKKKLKKKKLKKKRKRKKKKKMILNHLIGQKMVPLLQ